MADKKEVPLTLQKYLTDSKGHMTALGSSSDILKFQWFIENGVVVTTDHPDAFIKVGNEILIIEHFAIDGYEEKEHVGSLATYNERAIHTKLEKQEIAKALGFRTHSAVLKRIRKIGKAYERFAGEDFGFTETKII